MSQTPTPETVSPQSEQTITAKKGVFQKILIGLFLLGVVAAECLTVYSFLPGEAETAVLAGVAPASDQNNPSASFPTPGEPLTPEVAVPQVEVDLGQFTITSYQPISNTTLRIDFHLYGTVATEDHKAFQEALQANIHRFRDQVIVILRAAELTDLTDAGLGLIKRKILEKTNAMLGKRYLKAVIFSDFSFIEQ